MSDDAPHTGALLVATPTAADPVNAASEEDQAHVTLLWFGDMAMLSPDATEAIRTHAADVADSTAPFTAKVSGRAILGSDNAGVLILESMALAGLRRDLFDHPAVQDAYLQAEQFPHWVPHLTIAYGKGLPGAGIESVEFGAVGFWRGGQHEAYPLQVGEPLMDDEPNDDEEALISSGLTIPPVLEPMDLPLCIRHAEQHPDARWYAMKRAVALGRPEQIPAGWAES